MEAKERASRGGEISMAEKKSPSTEVVITVSGEENPKEPNGSASREAESLPPIRGAQDTFNKPSTESSVCSAAVAKPVSMGSSSPEISRFTPSPNKPPKVPTPPESTLTRRRTVTRSRSVYSKSKARFEEQPYHVDASSFEENTTAWQEQAGGNSPYRGSLSKASPNNSSTRSTAMNPPDLFGEVEYEEIFKLVEKSNEKRRRVKPMVIIEWAIVVSITACLVASLTKEKLKKYKFWGLEFWKWCVLAMVIFCGLLITTWFMHLVVFLIERNFILRKKVLYFVHGLKKTVQVFIWLSFVLLTWVLLFLGIERSETATKILEYVTWTLASILIGAFLWLLKTLLLKILASNFHMNKFFDRIQDSVFHQYVLQTLSGPPLVEEAERIGRSPTTGHLSFRNIKGKGGKEKRLIDMGKVHKMKREKVSAWTMKTLVDGIMNSRLSTISNELDESAYDEGAEQTDNEITNEMQAAAAAYHIFKNVVRPGCRYIDEDALLRFMIKEEVDLVLPLFEGAETSRQIDINALTYWVVKVYKERKALAHALNDTKTAVKQLHKIVAVILIIITLIIWLLLMGIANTKVLFLISSQFVAAAFLFGNTCKNIFEAIIFVFVMHPFDVGDRCVVDGLQLLVEEMNILTTVFLKLDNEKLYYPNSVLATKPIGNYYRSPDMVDNVEFSIDFATSAEKIGKLKEKIKEYLEGNPLHWYPGHSVIVKEIVNVNSIKMGLFCTHTMNFQDFGEKTRRRTELVLELKKIFEELDIKYNLLPQPVHIRPLGSQDSEPTVQTSRS
ncbi:hypothetical protein SLE2022_148000 [Rubroshorea leprosula]